MKIAYIVPGLDPTGPIIVVRNLISVLAKMGHEIEVYFFKHRKTEMEFCCPTFRIHQRERIDFDRFDIVHSHCLIADWYVNRWKKSFSRAHWITTIHQETENSFSFFYPKLISKILTKYWLRIQNKADCVIAISKQIKNIHTHWITTNFQVIYNGIDINDKLSMNENNFALIDKVKKIRRSNRFIVATFANIVERKGIDQVLQCMVNNVQFDFVVIGDGPYKTTLIEMTNNLGISDRVHFFPFIARPYLCLAPIDVYVMPSYSEGFGLALLEAAYMGKAIVCSNIPSFHELFDDDEVMFFDIRNIESLSNSLNMAYENKVSLGEKSHKKSERFTKEIMAENHLNLYESLVLKYRDYDS